MYEAYYGLREKPFSILPDPELIYWGKNHRLAFSMLEFGVTNNAGFTVITGAIGSGKTTLLRFLLKKLREAKPIVSFFFSFLYLFIQFDEVCICLSVLCLFCLVFYVFKTVIVDDK